MQVLLREIGVLHSNRARKNVHLKAAIEFTVLYRIGHIIVYGLEQMFSNFFCYEAPLKLEIQRAVNFIFQLYIIFC